MQELLTALAAAQAELKPVKKDGKNPFLKNKYATLDNIIEEARRVLPQHGLSFYQLVSDNGVETVIGHTSGQLLSSGCLRIEPSQEKGLSTAQSMGVTITYAKRYQLGAILGLSSDEDTDGAIVPETKPQSQQTAAQQPAPAKTFTPLQKVMPAINQAITVEELTAIYNNNKDLQSDADFVKCLTSKRESIQRQANKQREWKKPENPIIND